MSNPTPAPAEALSREQLQALRGHTQGPWEVFPKLKYNEWHVSVPIEGTLLRLGLFADGVPSNNPEADARLIAAAPDLLNTALAALARAEAAEAERDRLLRSDRFLGEPTIHKTLEEAQAAVEARRAARTERRERREEGDKHRRLSPYVRDEATLQRGIEQTAQAQTRAAMTAPNANVIEFDKYQPTAAQVLNRVAEYIEAAQQHYAAHDAGKYDSELEHAYGCKRDELEDLDAAHLRTLAQAHADQQARLRGLVEKWRDKSATDGLFIDVAFPGDTVGRIANQQRNRCADELEAVLGGKE